MKCYDYLPLRWGSSRGGRRKSLGKRWGSETSRTKERIQKPNGPVELSPSPGRLWCQVGARERERLWRISSTVLPRCTGKSSVLSPKLVKYWAGIEDWPVDYPITTKSFLKLHPITRFVIYKLLPEWWLDEVPPGTSSSESSCSPTNN